MFQAYRTGTSTLDRGANVIRPKWIQGLYVYVPMNDVYGPLVRGVRSECIQTFGPYRGTLFAKPQNNSGLNSYHAGRDAYGSYWYIDTDISDPSLDFADSTLYDIVLPMGFSCWARIDDLGDYCVLVSKFQGVVANLYVLSRTTPSVKLSFGFTVGGVFKELNVANGAHQNVWTHYACTYDGVAQRIYINGTLAAEAAVSGAIDTVSTQLNFMGHITGVGAAKGGAIREAAIWSGRSQPISAADVADLYREKSLFQSVPYGFDPSAALAPWEGGTGGGGGGGGRDTPREPPIFPPKGDGGASLESDRYIGRRIEPTTLG